MVSTARNNIIDQYPQGAKVVENDRPWKQERDLEIEDDEQERDQVKASVEAHACVVKRRKTAFVRRKLLGVGSPVSH